VPPSKRQTTFSQYAFQVNETHTFNASTLNEASFATMRVEGVQPATGLFSVPVVNVTGGGQGFGSGFAQGDFIQHNYHWRDVLTHTFRSHNIKAGYEGLFADDVEIFNGPYDQPTFNFNSLLDLARDNVFTETGIAYNPTTGEKTQYSWDAAGLTNGAFIEDTWKINRKVTLNYGLRWDDFGNPYQRTPSTVFGNFFMGPGPTLQTQIANGSVIAHHHALNRSITDVFSPRIGVAWDVIGDGKWLVKGGFGFFHNWPTLANLQEQYRGNPPGNIFPTFQANSASPAPIFGLGTSNNKPFNFPYPVLPARPLNPQGGITGLQFNIGGIDPNLISPVTYTYSAAVDRELGRHLVGIVGMKLALLREEGQGRSAVVFLAEEHAHRILGEGQLRIETMRLLKVTKDRVHLGHLLCENTASQVETRLRRKLLYAKREEINSYFKGAMVEGHLGEGQVCDRVSGTQRKLNHPDRTAILVKQFKEAKAHNQEAKTKYVLQEAQPPQ
jgi:hypothetical protein